MEIYTILVVILFFLAFMDLIVGVSNDAVNFLNSAIGSRVASFRTILVVASAGILMGSTFSEGIMEVARNGIFNPSFFTFDKVMIIFMAVMLTDILLLDVYNTFGLPTSTTVSIVFSLLGASCLVAVLVISQNNLGIGTFNDFINVNSAVTIISGIFISVGIAFVIGAIVQYVTRLAFSFDLSKSTRKFGGIFSGLSISIIVYFLLIKGAKGSSIISDAQTEWIEQNTWGLMLGCFAIFTVVTQVLYMWKQVNPLRIVVLLGTFALAMAFAGNDLVNFIGVAIAGYQSLNAWTASGVAADSFTMEALVNQVTTPTSILLVSGVVMMVTIWTNAKSRKVTETEVSLGRQDDGDERFAANKFSRSIVGAAISVGSRINGALPKNWTGWANRRLTQRSAAINQSFDQPSFDLLRAAVNLLVSSALIALGTSKKLPLSTTFVTFMVAMGSSFADQAWGRDSAVYRVAGVVNVVAGWFLTAAMAFITSALIAAVIYQTGFVGTIVVTLAVGVFLYWSYRFFNRKAAEEKMIEQEMGDQTVSTGEFHRQVKNNSARNLKTVLQIFKASRTLLSGEKVKQKEILKNISKLEEQNEKLNRRIIRNIKTLDNTQLSEARFNILLFDLMQDLFQSAEFLYSIADKHIQNHHSVPEKPFQSVLTRVEKLTEKYFASLVSAIQQSDYSDTLFKQQHDDLLTEINDAMDAQIREIQKDELSNRLGLLQTKFLLEVKDITENIYEVYVLHRDFAARTLKPA